MNKKCTCSNHVKPEKEEKEKSSVEQESNESQELENDVLQACQKERDHWKEKFIRVTADLENFKRRSEKEQSQWYQQAQAEVLSGILDVVDNFDRALQEKKEERTPELESWLEGFTLIHKSLQKFLQKNEVKEITEMVVFDPQYHEALAQVESETKKPGEIVDTLEKGYTFKGSLLRPAKVTVAR